MSATLEMPPAEQSAATIDDVRQVVRRHWEFDSFRPLQQEAIESVLAGRDSVVVLPTGGGKSLCFQAPACCLEGVAVVVSPLISLMKDQVDALRENGVAAALSRWPDGRAGVNVTKRIRRVVFDSNRLRCA